ncbi:MAG: 1-acyl-sn-glycerol-3-phosphate acyltransferase [Spirochaetes bacterium]|nr:1-acyl-sn-glycerol-3-phosphate acyltransferase [Spirochaetota bacterium]
MGAILSVIGIIGLLMLHDFLVRIVAIVSYPAARRLSGALMVPTACRIFTVLSTYTGLRLDFGKYDRKRLPDRFLVVSNHQSLFDIPILIEFFGGTADLRFVAKLELGRWIPYVSSALRYQRHALIARTGDLHGTMHALVSFTNAAKRSGACPVLFPEGTRSRDGKAQTFHSAGFRKILEIDPLPIVLVALDGGWKIASLGAVFSGMKETTFRARLVSVDEMPIDKKSQLAYLEDARNRISAELVAMRAETPSAGGRAGVHNKRRPAT